MCYNIFATKTLIFKLLMRVFLFFDKNAGSLSARIDGLKF